MTHETDCPFDALFFTSDGVCLTCNAVRRAYDRGRQDAASDVALLEEVAWNHSNGRGMALLPRMRAIFAARGDAQ